MGVGEAVADKKILNYAVPDLKKISGQQPVICKARVSVATFKVRTGFPVGCKATLRRERMWEFLDRLINIAIPRVRDFRGLSAKSFDGRGNYSMGVKEQIIFPRDRLRPGGCDSRPGHLYHHHGKKRHRGAGAAEIAQLPSALIRGTRAPSWRRNQ